MNSAEFRKQLVKIMPGYKWTIRRQGIFDKTTLTAIGIQSAGFNRLSTLSVIRREDGDTVMYEVASSGFGLRAPWLGEYTDTTLARALRGLQAYYQSQAKIFSDHASALQAGRNKNLAG